MKKIRTDIDSRLAQTILCVIMIVTIFLVFLPVLITINFSLKTTYEIMTSIWSFPKVAQWSNWGESIAAVLPNMLNSIVIGCVSTFFTVLLGSISAYIFVRLKFFGKKFLFSFIIAIMMIPSIITITPLFLMVLDLNLKNSWFAIWLPSVGGGQVAAFFLFHTFFRQQPAELFEAARIDGASEMRSYLNITIPLAVPILIVQALGTFSGAYNDYLWPSIVITDNAKKPLMPILQSLANTMSTIKKGISYAMYLMSSIPLIITTLIGLKYFVSGDFAAGMKL